MPAFAVQSACPASAAVRALPGVPDADRFGGFAKAGGGGVHRNRGIRFATNGPDCAAPN
jgi:hypothetical protein